MVCYDRHFKDKEVPRRRWLVLGASFAVAVLLVATLAYLLLRGRSEALKMAALVFAAGPLAVIAFADVIVEAHEGTEDTRGLVTPIHSAIGPRTKFSRGGAPTLELWPGRLV